MWSTVGKVDVSSVHKESPSDLVQMFCESKKKNPLFKVSLFALTIWVTKPSAHGYDSFRVMWSTLLPATDLDMFSTKALVSTCGDHEMEVREQVCCLVQTHSLLIQSHLLLVCMHWFSLILSWSVTEVWILLDARVVNKLDQSQSKTQHYPQCGSLSLVPRPSIT